ncbi:MAG: aminotransferase class IV [Bacteroidota bacterium]
MKNEVYNTTFICNSQLMEKNAADLIRYYDGTVVYEVIRVIDGIPLFMEDHLLRLHNSASLAGFFIAISDSEIINSIKQLTIENQIFNGNVKLLFQHKEHQPLQFLCFFIQHNYPNELQYKNGVKVRLYEAERKNPNAKLLHSKLHQASENEIHNNDIYEILYVNKNAWITEGSKSNVFFFKENVLYTAPKKMVLPGITRKYVIKYAHLSDINVVEESVHSKNIDQYDAAFISGTSPKILPISFIGSIKYNVNHPLLEKLMKDYDEEIENYIYQFS